MSNLQAIVTLNNTRDCMGWVVIDDELSCALYYLGERVYYILPIDSSQVLFFKAFYQNNNMMNKIKVQFFCYF